MVCDRAYGDPHPHSEISSAAASPSPLISAARLLSSGLLLEDAAVQSPKCGASFRHGSGV